MRLLGEGASVDAKSEKGTTWTALHLAAHEGHAEVVTMLIKNHGADSNASTKCANTALHFAAISGHAEVCRQLVEYGIDVNARNDEQWTALHFAVVYAKYAPVFERVQACRLLSELGADISATTQDQGRTMLHQAVLSGNFELCLLFIEGGMEVNAKDKNEGTPFHYAVSEEGNIEVCRLLVDHGADVSASANDISPIHTAAQGNHVQLCKILIEEWGADVNAKDDVGSTPLKKAVRNGSIELCRVLLELGADANWNNGMTVLHSAAIEGHAGLCQLLLKTYGANVHARTTTRGSKGCTPLHLAAGGGFADVCKMLIEQFGADVHARDGAQSTPLHTAAALCQPDASMVLILHGADLHAREKNQWTPAETVEGQEPVNIRQRRALTHEDIAQRRAMKAHLQNSDGVHYLRCTGPSLERKLVWNDTTAKEEEAMLDTMHVQWLLKVKKGCEEARLGLTVRGIHSGKFSLSVLMRIMGFVFGGTKAHLRSCVSSGRLSNVMMTVVTGQGTMHQGPAPRLALMSYALALQITPTGPHEELHDGGLAVLLTSEECVWLQGYLHFLQQRHLPRTTSTGTESLGEEACCEEDHGNDIEDGIHQPLSPLEPAGTEDPPSRSSTGPAQNNSASVRVGDELTGGEQAVSCVDTAPPATAASSEEGM
jgi:ankyrin repeat protein